MTVNSPQEPTDYEGWFETAITELFRGLKEVKEQEHTTAFDLNNAEGEVLNGFANEVLRWNQLQLASLLTELEAKAPESLPQRTGSNPSKMLLGFNKANDGWRTAIAVLRREHGL